MLKMAMQEEENSKAYVFYNSYSPLHPPVPTVLSATVGLSIFPLLDPELLKKRGNISDIIMHGIREH